MKNIIRVKKETGYVVIDKTFLNDKRLSWKAKGILAFMLSRPDDWTFYQKELMKHSIDGKTSFNGGFKELRDCGYVQKVQKRLENGQFEYETIVYERPYTDNPLTDNPSTDNPLTDNQSLLNNNQLSNKELSNNKYIPYADIIDYLNEKAGKKFKHTANNTRKLIQARWNEGNRLEDFKKVIDVCCKKWSGQVFSNGQNGDEYLRPSTLFNGKFDERLNWSVEKEKVTKSKKSPEQLQHEKELREMQERIKANELSGK